MGGEIKKKASSHVNQGNNIDVVSALMNHRHKGHYMVWNVSEETYDYSKVCIFGDERGFHESGASIHEWSSAEHDSATQRATYSTLHGPKWPRFFEGGGKGGGEDGSLGWALCVTIRCQNLNLCVTRTLAII